MTAHFFSAIAKSMHRRIKRRQILLTPLRFTGVAVPTDTGTTLIAGNDLTVQSAQSTFADGQYSKQSQSGPIGGYSDGMLSLGYGSSSLTGQDASIGVQQVGSSISSQNGDVTLSAGNKATIAASDIAAGGDLTIVAKDIELQARQDTGNSLASQSGHSSGLSLGLMLDPVAAYQSGRDAATSGEPTSTSTVGELGRLFDGYYGGLTAAVTQQVVTGHSQSANGQQGGGTSKARVSQLGAGGNLTLLATDGSITSEGAQMSAGGDATLIASDNITLGVAHSTQAQTQGSKVSGIGLANNTFGLPVGTYDDKSNGAGLTDTITGTQLSVGGNATLATVKGDIGLTATNIAADGDVNIAAARNLTIQSGQDTAANDNTSNNKAIGTVVVSDTERFSGYHTEDHIDNNAKVTQVASNVGSLNGDVNLSAGGAYTQTASNVLGACRT